MNNKPTIRISSVIAVISTAIAIASLSFNVIQYRESKKEKEIESIPNLSFYYWRFPGTDWLICEYFTDDMLIDLKKISPATEHVKESFPGIKLAHNRQFDKFKQARHRICADRRPSLNDIKNWKVLFVTNDAHHRIQIKAIEYDSKERDENLDINLEGGQGLLIPLGFTQITTTGPNAEDYVRLTNMDISWPIGDEVRDYTVVVPTEDQRASGCYVAGMQGGVIWYEPPAVSKEEENKD